MSKKSWNRKALKTLFSRSRERPSGHAQRVDAQRVDEAEEKKSFSFFKMKMKTRSEQQLSRTPSEDEDLVQMASGRKPSSVCRTSSRVKQLSYSESDLQQSSKSSTFSFGLRKKRRRRKDDGNLCSSVIGLQHCGEKEEESPLDQTQDLDLTQIQNLNLTQAMDWTKPKTQFSMSQPELDSSRTFDIPSPPPLASNQTGPYWTLLDRRPPNPQTKFFQQGMLRDSIALNQELQLDSSGSSEGTEAWVLGPASSSSTGPSGSWVQVPGLPEAPEPTSDVTECTSDAVLGHHIVSVTIFKSNSISSEAQNWAEPVFGPCVPSETIWSSEPESRTRISTGSDPETTNLSVGSEDQEAVCEALHRSLFPQKFTSESHPEPVQVQNPSQTPRTASLYQTWTSPEAQNCPEPHPSQLSPPLAPPPTKVAVSSHRVVLADPPTSDTRPPPMDAMDPPADPQVLLDRPEPAVSPLYLSVDSDDSGGAERYFSAKEDSGGEGGEGGGPAPPAQQECDSAPPPADTVAVETGARKPPDLRDQFVALEQEPEEGHAHNRGAGSAPERHDRRERDNTNTQDPADLERSLVATDGMSSAYSSLSTRLVEPMEEESSHRGCKVSLINESQESGFGSGSSPEFSWKNRFGGVMPFRASSESLEHIAPGNTAAAEGGGVASAPGEGGVPSAESLNTCWDSQQIHGDQSPPFIGPFRATLVQLEAPPCTPPSSPQQLDMDTLVDTLRNMGPSFRPRAAAPRPPPPVLSPSLPPIVEDAGSPSTPEAPHPTGTGPGDSSDGLYRLPVDLGLKRTCSRDSRPPLERMKGSQDLNPPALNGSGVLRSPPTSSRLDSSVLFGSLRSSSSNAAPESEKPYRSLFRTASLPDTGLSNDRIDAGSNDTGEVDPAGSRLERLSLLVTSSSSLNGTEDSRGLRMSQPPSLNVYSPTTSGSPTGLNRTPLSMFAQGPGVLERTFSGDGGPTGVLGSPLGNVKTQFQNQPPEPDKNLMSKYRAFPDAYLTKEKEHGKLNPRPGKMYIFDRPGMCGQRIEVRGDVIDATPWELQETISIRVVRGGWVLYEKPHFKGEKMALDEGDIEMTCPFKSSETPGISGEETEDETSRRVVIGSVRRAVRDYSVPEICLFPEENAEGKKVIFRDTSEDARIFGFPVKANSIIINAGLWLVFSQPFFQGVPRVLEVGGYSNPAAWGVEQPYVGSLHPLKVGEPRVENTTEAKMVVFEKPYFSGKSRTVTVDARDFMTRTDQQQAVFMHTVGSLKVLGGMWVGYEKEGFRGHQYLLEEGEYHDWRTWGGRDLELRSARIIRADLSDPLMVLLEQPEEEEVLSEENSFEVTEAVPDVEMFGFRTSTRSIHVLSGAWVAYSHVDFSGDQYVLEKGFYSTCSDWGSQDPRICSVQPILLAPTDGSRTRREVVLYSEPDFQGQHHILDHQEAVMDQFPIRSSRVAGGSWVLYDNTNFSGNVYVLSEGDYPSLTSMGCPSSTSIRSLKPVPMIFSIPSISLFGLECLEGREVTVETEIPSLVQEGLNNQVLSIRVNSGWWVICEHINYRGRQFLLEPIEITNWTKFSSLQTVGSMYPLRQKRHFFRLKNLETGRFLSVQGGVEDMKAGRVVASPEVEPSTDIWFYQDGLIKNKVAPSMSLQVMGDLQPAAKVVLWSESRQPVQTWTGQMEGLISSLTFPGVVLDIKGGKTYDRDHAVVMPENEERPSQRWQILPL